MTKDTAIVEEQTTSSVSTEQIWEEFSESLRRFVYSKVSNQMICDDIIQDIFYKIHKSINDLKDNSKLNSWLFQIARNSIIDYFRTEKKAQLLLEDMKAEETYVKKTSFEILRYCMIFFLSRLPKKYEKAIIFTEFEGNSQIELSKEEGISVSAAKSRVQRAKKLLGDIVTDYSGFQISRSKIDLSDLENSCPLNKV